MFVCVRDRERERGTDRQTDRKLGVREREGGGGRGRYLCAI